MQWKLGHQKPHLGIALRRNRTATLSRWEKMAAGEIIQRHVPTMVGAPVSEVLHQWLMMVNDG